MEDPRVARIADLERQIAEAVAARDARAAEPAPGFDFFGKPEPEPGPEPDYFIADVTEPGPSMYSGYQHPDEAHERITAAGHAVGTNAGLGAAVSN